MKVEKIIMNAISHHTYPGTAAKSVAGRCGSAKGTAITNDTRNIHFIDVTTEYRAIRFLQVPRYNAKTM